MEKKSDYSKPSVEIFNLSDEVIVTSGCGCTYEGGTAIHEGCSFDGGISIPVSDSSSGGCDDEMMG